MTGEATLNGVGLGLLLASAVLSWPLTWLLLHRYRTQVVRAMRRSSAKVTSEWRVAPDGSSPGASDHEEHVAADRRPTRPPLTRAAVDTAIRDARSQRSQVWRQYAAAGVAQAVVLTLATFASTGLQLLPWRTVIVGVVYMWPVVLAGAILSGFSARTVVRALILYGAVLLVLGAVAGNIAAGPLLWALMNGPATAVVIPYLHRSVRAVGVVVVLFVLIGLLGAEALVSFVSGSDERITTVATIATQLGGGGVAAFVALLVVGFSVAATVGWFALGRIGRAYRDGLPDQLVLIGAVWAVFAATQGIPLAFESLAWAAGAPVAFAAFWLIAGRPRTPEQTSVAARLLVLRTFSLGRLSEDLFRRVVADWRYVGPIRLIGGPDLARSTIEPDRFLTFAAGRLEQLFIATPEQFDQRRRATTVTRDRHGGYRVDEFLCFDDTWRHVVRALMRDTDLVLVDVRGLATGNDGTRDELAMLARLGMLERTVLVVDGDTDLILIAAAAAAGGGDLAVATLVTLPVHHEFSTTDLLDTVPVV